MSVPSEDVQRGIVQMMMFLEGSIPPDEPVMQPALDYVKRAVRKNLVRDKMMKFCDEPVVDAPQLEKGESDERSGKEQGGS